MSITATREGPSLIITVADDGVGVDISDIKQGIGLRSVRERVIARSTVTTLAAMNVQSGLGAGFRVTIALPWQVS